jgi:hypothetical protein
MCHSQSRNRRASVPHMGDLYDHFRGGGYHVFNEVARHLCAIGLLSPVARCTRSGTQRHFSAEKTAFILDMFGIL